MSIFAYVGLPGSGKSYNVVANVILPALRDGRRVVTNVPLNRDLVLLELAAAAGDDSSVGELVDFPVSQVAQDPELMTKYVRNGDVLVLDEIWKLWPSGVKTSDVPDVYKTLLAEHRHMVDEQGRSVHVALVVQDLKMCAVFARSLVEQTYIHRKLGDMGMEGRYRVDIYAGAILGTSGSDKMFIRSVFGEYQESVWRFYQSHTKAVGVSGGAKGERSVDRRGSFLKRPIFVFGLPACVVVAVLVLLRVKHEEERIMHPQKTEVSSDKFHAGFVDAVHQPAAAGVFSGVGKLTESRATFRVLGYIEVPGSPERSKALLISDSGQRIVRSMSACRFIDHDYFECNVGGTWYGSVGKSLVDPDRAVLVSLPAGALKGNLPVGAGEAAEGGAPPAVPSPFLANPPDQVSGSPRPGLALKKPTSSGGVAR